MRRMEREFQADMERALAALRRAVERDISDANVRDMVSRLNDETVTRPFTDAVIAAMQRAALAGAGFGREQVERHVFGVAKAIEISMWELANNAAAAWAITTGQNLAGAMLMTTSERIQNEIANYILNSETIGQLIDRIRNGYGYSEQRARTIAVTEITRAFHRGSLESWKASGEIEKMIWRTNVDELVCKICGPLDGKVVGLDEEFADGISGPPAHPRCRCWTVPQVE